MKALVRVAGLVLGLAPCSVTNLSAFSIPEIVGKAKPAVVQVIAVDTNLNPFRTGTGFFITGDGVLVTNDHVIAGAADVLAQTSTGAIYLFRGVIFQSVSLDLALLKFAARGVPYLKLGSSVHVAEGQRVIVIGRPGGLEETVSDGIISAFGDNRSSIQITAAIAPPSSGSPVLDESGQVIGIATSSTKEGQNLNFAIAVETVKTAILAEGEEQGKDKSQEADTTPKFRVTTPERAMNKR